MDNYLFAGELAIEPTSQQPDIASNKSSWKVLIVDDELLVHKVTKSVLGNVVIDGRNVNLISAYTAKEALELLTTHDDIAVIFLDVVMETEDAGLMLCKTIREDLNNDMVQIIIRTGQPGANPENEVILKYKINDYKEKTEISAQKLFTCLVSALRSYQNLVKVKQNKAGLNKIIVATQQLSKVNSVPLLMDGVLSQLVTLVDYCERSFVFKVKSNGQSNHNVSIDNISLMSCFGSDDIEDVDAYITALQQRVIINTSPVQSLYKEKEYLVRFHFGPQDQYILYLEAGRPLTRLDLELLAIFSSNIQVAIDNLCAYQQQAQSQQDNITHCINILNRANIPQNDQLHSVAKLAGQLALDFGLEPRVATDIKLALLFNRDAQLLGNYQGQSVNNHDLDKSHPLTNSQLLILQNILQQQGEHFDGSGQPKQLSGTAISVEARIVALVRVFDSLSHRYDHEKAWPNGDVADLLTEQHLAHYDPKLVALLIKNIEIYHRLQFFEHAF